MRSFAMAAPGPVRLPAPSSPLPEVVRRPPRRPQPRRWWWLVGGILVAAAALAWRLVLPRLETRKVVAMPRTAVVRRGALERTLRVSGVTVAQKSATLLIPQLWGGRERGSHEYLQVLQKLVPAGTHVHKGQIVAEFDRLYMLNRMDDYKAWVDQYRSNLRKLNAALEVKRKAYEQQIRRAKADVDKSTLELGRAPVLSAIKVENTRLNLEEAKARYKEIVAEAQDVEISEKAAIRASELSLQRHILEFERARRNADRMIVAAPLDGMVVMQSIRRGNDTGEIQQGDQLSPGQPYMQIVDLSSMAVEASLNQVDARRVRLGQHARVQFEAYPDLQLPARVTAVTGFARSRGWRGNYVTEVPVRLRLERMDKRVIPNFSVSVDLVLERSEDAVLCPLECVFREGDKAFAYVQNPAGWEKRELELGISNAIAAAVTSGLREGEVVAAEVPSHAIFP